MRTLTTLLSLMSIALLVGQGCPGTPPPNSNPPPDNNPPPVSNTPSPLPDGVIAVRADATGKNDGSSWADAYQDLQDALAAALVPGNTIQQIWVAKGVYKPAGPGGNRNVYFQMINDVAVYGGFAGTESRLSDRDFNVNPTVLSGDLNGDDEMNFTNRGDNSKHIVIADGTMATAILDGFTLGGGDSVDDAQPIGAGLYITNGAVTIRNCIFEDNIAQNGGAVGMLNPIAPVLQRCTFRSNQATQDAGAVVIYNGDTQLIDCAFENNTANEGGAMRIFFGNPQLTRCTFSNNLAHTGGAIFTSAELLKLDNCVFQMNTSTLDTTAETYNGGGAIYTVSEVLAYNCVFQKNTAGTLGGAVHYPGDGTSYPFFYGCLFDRNRAFEGGALFCTKAVISNCTLSGNIADNVGGGMDVDSAALTNSILWSNRDATGVNESAQVYQDAPDAISFAGFCDIQGLTPALAAKGNGNISADPQFVDAANGDLHLKSTSPCIDKGSNDYIGSNLTTDLDGNPRLQGTPPVVDIGAYEQ